MRREAERIAKGIFNNKIKSGTIDPVMTKLVAEELRKAVIKGFGEDLPKIDFGTPDYKMLSNLEKNIFHFSAAKNYQELKVLSSLLRKEDGSIKPWTGFRNDAMKALDVFNGSHLQTEYDTAIASSQMASKWVDFEKNKAVMPLLRYETVGDSRVRPTHQVLDGVTRPVDDPFWEMYYPPNGWRCRCDVLQLVSGKATPPDQITTPDDVPAIFKTNMAKNGQVFPKGHAYWDGVPDAVLKKAEGLRNNVYSKAYTSTKTKATIEVSNMADLQDFDQNFESAKVLADNSVSCKIRPHFDAKGIKNPELELPGNQVADFKRLQPEKSLKNSIEKNIKLAAVQECQVPVLIIEKKDYNALQIVRALNNILTEKKVSIVTEVWIIVEKKLIKISKEEILARSYYGKL